MVLSLRQVWKRCMTFRRIALVSIGTDGSLDGLVRICCTVASADRFVWRTCSVFGAMTERWLRARLSLGSRLCRVESARLGESWTCWTEGRREGSEGEGRWV